MQINVDERRWKDNFDVPRNTGKRLIIKISVLHIIETALVSFQSRVSRISDTIEGQIFRNTLVDGGSLESSDLRKRLPNSTIT